MKTLKVAIQGIETSFHDIAAHQYFGNNIEVIECDSFKMLCDSLKSKEADYAVMAIENTLAGSLLPNYSLLQDHHFHIIGETFLNIQLHLMVLPGVKFEDIKYIESHPIAIQQCNQFLWNCPDKEVIEKKDTAECAKYILEHNLTNTAAIANDVTATRFGLEIIESRIETHKQNFTRFLILSRELEVEPEDDKASIYFELSHQAGSLAEVLMVFKNMDINLTKIQSVPIIGKPYEYSFHIDLEWANKNAYTVSLMKVREMTHNLTVLGEYKKGSFEMYNSEYDYSRS